MEAGNSGKGDGGDSARLRLAFLFVGGVGFVDGRGSVAGGLSFLRTMMGSSSDSLSDTNGGHSIAGIISA